MAGRDSARNRGGARGGVESGENKRGFPVALHPNFKLSPLSGGGGRGGGRGGGGVRVAGARDGTKVSVCIKPRARGRRLSENEPPRRLLCGLRVPWLRALPHEPRLKFNSNSPAFCGSAFPRSRNPRGLRSLTSADPPLALRRLLPRPKILLRLIRGMNSSRESQCPPISPRFENLANRLSRDSRDPDAH